jgi:hypothetical protein
MTASGGEYQVDQCVHLSRSRHTGENTGESQQYLAVIESRSKVLGTRISTTVRALYSQQR